MERVAAVACGTREGPASEGGGGEPAPHTGAACTDWPGVFCADLNNSWMPPLPTETDKAPGGIVRRLPSGDIGGGGGAGDTTCRPPNKCGGGEKPRLPTPKPGEPMAPKRGAGGAGEHGGPGVGAGVAMMEAPPASRLEAPCTGLGMDLFLGLGIGGDADPNTCAAVRSGIAANFLRL